jgi:ABC-type transport system involved in cytochrome bd biosynthesis fused ATPase/permease subunit
MKLQPRTFFNKFLTKNVFILIILGNILPIFYFFLCIFYNKLAINSINYNLSQFTTIQINFLLIYIIYYGLLSVNNILFKKIIQQLTDKIINGCLLEFNNQKNYNESTILSFINNIKQNHNDFCRTFIGFVGNVAMIFVVNYMVYSFHVKYLLWNFIGFFIIKLIFNFYMYKKNYFISDANHLHNKLNIYFNNIIDNYCVLNTFNCKNLIIKNLEQKQKKYIKYYNLSNIFSGVLDFLFNNIDIIQWVINNILIFKFTGQNELLARLFNIGLINWFYQDLLMKFNYQLPTLINNYKLLELNYNYLLEDEKISVETPSQIVLNGDFIMDIDLTIDNKSILKNIFIDIAHIKKKLNKPYVNLGIIGLSGAGKSSLLKSMMNFIPFDGSMVFDSNDGKVNGNNLSRENYLKNILYISQDKYIFEDTLLNNIVLQEDLLNKIPHQDEKFLKFINQILIMLNIKQNLHEEISNNSLSGGEKSRINIARSIVNTPEPNLIIMDELEASLDAITYHNIYRFIMENYPINKIISTHDISTIMNLDYFIFMDKGEILIEGNLDECLKNPIFYNLINLSKNLTT